MEPEISEAHLIAANRRRRIVVNFDVSYPIDILCDAYPELSDLVEHLFAFADAKDSTNDSIWWNWCEGNQVPYPSEFLPLFDHPAYRRWVEEGTDVVRIVLEATYRRGLEAFHSHRMNGSDNDLGRHGAASLLRGQRRDVVGLGACPSRAPDVRRVRSGGVGAGHGD